MLVLAAIKKQASFPDTWDNADPGYRNTRTDVARYLTFLETGRIRVSADVPYVPFRITTMTVRKISGAAEPSA